MKIKVIYLARLSEDMGKKEEYIELSKNSSTIEEIFSMLGLDNFDYKIHSAKNYSHSKFEDNIKDGDEIAFFPTITGG
tara:strand:- start:1973 stop:2206 length:234 start_codon:yes stop_codon:yes gene_type:complete